MEGDPQSSSSVRFRLPRSLRLSLPHRQTTLLAAKRQLQLYCVPLDCHLGVIRDPCLTYLVQIVGYFTDPVDAAHARDCAALGLQGNPRLNFHAENYSKTQVLELVKIPGFHCQQKIRAQRAPLNFFCQALWL
eukprot:scaffold71492_cov19-Tisochrysis_lutea.AAC.1